MTKLFFFPIAVFGLLSCNDPDSKDERFIFERKIEKMEMESFKIPDSINTSLIIATYYNSDYDSQSLFVYKDETKKSVKKIDYLADSTIAVDQLEILKRNEFRSALYKVDYVIKENTISIISTYPYDHSSRIGKEYRRTDRD